MPGKPAYRSYRISMRAVIAGTEFDVVQFGASFELNGIPSATLLVPVGREVRSLQPAAIHATVARMKMRQPARVFLTLIPLAAGDPDGIGIPDLGIPDAGCEFIVFDGFTSGGGYRKSQGLARFEIGLHHWLIEMTDSSTLSYESHPLNPSEYTYGSLMPGQHSGVTQWTGLTSADQFITGASVQSDFWAEALRPTFDDLLKGNLLKIAARGGTIQGTKSNSGAQAALDRFKSPGDACYTPLGMSGTINQHIVQQISTATSRMLKNPDFMAHHTLWDVLVGTLSQEFLFSVVPRVMDAVVVPFIPGLQTHFAEIDAKEYVATALNSSMPRPLRGVGVQTAIGTRSGSDGFDDDAAPPKTLGLGGWYEGRDDGTIIIKQGPSWLTRPVVPLVVSLASTGGAGIKQSTVFDPDAGEHTPDRDQATRFANDLASLLDRYAHSLYCIEAIKGRQGTLSGPLRFDIAPGSTVRIEGASEAFIPGDQLGMPYFATVLRTTFALDAESGRAGSAFHLAHIRNAVENTEAATSVSQHPLWDAASFAGCTLAECGADTPATAPTPPPPPPLPTFPVIIPPAPVSPFTP
jgi:hypothetical protein